MNAGGWLTSVNPRYPRQHVLISFQHLNCHVSRPLRHSIAPWVLSGTLMNVASSYQSLSVSRQTIRSATKSKSQRLAIEASTMMHI